MKYKIELFLKIVGGIITIATILLGIYQFNKGQQHNEELEFQREIWQQQFTNYGKITEVAGILASEYTDTIAFKKSRIEFEKLYWGTMNIVTDSTVTEAMIEFREAVHDYNIVNKNAEALNRIKVRAVDLADSCNVSLKRKWDPFKTNK